MSNPAIAASDDFIRLPVVKSAVSDLEALEHARRIVAAAIPEPPTGGLTSRALSELDRLIDQARRGR